MRTLVTGATGFLGRPLCVALEQRGIQVTAVNSRNHDLRNSGGLDAIEGRFDIIFHLAAWTQAGDFCLRHPGEQWLINQQINCTVLNWWARRQPQAKLVSIGTSCAYDPALPLKEEFYLRGEPIADLYAYAMTKRMLHIGQLALHRQYGLRYLTLVPPTLYGPGYHTDGRQPHFIFDLMGKILRARHGGAAPVLWGDGYQKRDLVYLPDFVAAAVNLAETECNDVINVGDGKGRSIREFAQAICEEVGYDPGRISYDESRYVGARSKCLDVSKLAGLRPGALATPLGIGLRETMRWMEAGRAAGNK